MLAYFWFYEIQNILGKNHFIPEYSRRFHETIVSWSLPPVVCRRAHVLFKLLMFVCT
jgi:hypothetical protein